MGTSPVEVSPSSDHDSLRVLPVEAVKGGIVRFTFGRRIAIALLAPLLMVACFSFAAEDSPHPHWSYSGASGPQKWGTLEEDYSSCGLGKRQSPIDIRNGLAEKADLPPIEFHYKPTALKIIDNGHSVQINYEPGSYITVGGRRFELVQFHFHKPSEEKVNGKAYDMVAHLVHRNQDGKLAVVAVLLEKGSANPLIGTLWDNIPAQKGSEQAPGIRIDASALIPENTAYYTFAGSLTTPPCTEGVTWFVLRNPTTLSADQIARFARSYPMNARPVQPLNGREIRASR
jgi:carbonic anhydrase